MTKRFLLVPFLYVIALVLWGGVILAPTQVTVQAQENFGIAAVVNDSVVTHRDVENRMRLLFLDSGLQVNSRNEENLRRLARQQLIEETLQLQQITDLGIRPPPEGVATFIADMEQRNNLAAGGLRDVMRANGIEYDHFAKQQEIRVGWNLYLQRELADAGGISDSDVQGYIDSAAAREAEQFVHLREIFLPYESPLLIAKTEALAEDILRRLSTGADFAALARSFSASRSAGNGGSSGWVPTNHLSDNIRSAIAGLQEGEIASGIQTPTGIVIIKLEGRRQAENAAITDENQVRTHLQNKKLELLHRQHLHRLKNAAFIELR